MQAEKDVAARALDFACLVFGLPLAAATADALATVGTSADTGGADLTGAEGTMARPATAGDAISRPLGMQPSDDLEDATTIDHRPVQAAVLTNDTAKQGGLVARL